MVSTKLNPKTTELEFSGIPGALGISIGLPLLCNVLYFACNENGCPASWSSLAPYAQMLGETKAFSWQSMSVYLAWFFGLVWLDILVPGKEVQGTTLRDGSSLRYKFNGKNVMTILGYTLISRAIYTRGELPELKYVYDHLLELLNASLLWSILIATYVYVASFMHQKEPIIALGGNSENVIFDWFIGRELNPRVGNFDIKLFCEMRPGLLLWVIINLACAHHQYMTLGYVTDSMALVVLFQSYYVIEGTFYEIGLINMMDVITDGFGFMLSFGDLTLVPFTYTLQARYLAEFPINLGWFKSTAIIVVFLAGLLIFRLSNNEKNAFKRGEPSSKHLKYIESESGSKLIVSGWWGMARHINYLGDWLISWAYSLPTGFSTIITYYFVFFFAGLLIHRETRDEAKCAEKYGKTWVEYKKKVPYRIIPGVY